MRFNSIGSDPEVFLKKENNFISSIGIVGGTKEEPRQLTKDYYVQEDNVLAEFNIPPCSSLEEFKTHLKGGLAALSDTLPKGVFITKEASALFPKEQLEHPNAKVFGCEPDLNCWTFDHNEMPAISIENLRTAGGHVHLGLDTESVIDLFYFARCLDIFLGLPSVLLDTDNTRKLLYGKAGAFRIKPYGLEYRVLSNFWIFDESLIDYVYQNSLLAIAYFNSLENKDIPGNEIITAINANDTKECLRLMGLFNVPSFKNKTTCADYTAFQESVMTKTN